MSKEKKQTIILTIVLIIVAAALIIAFALTKPKNKNTTYSKDESSNGGSSSSNTKVDEKESEEIMKKFEEYFTSKDKEIIFYASSTCGWCSLQKPILDTIAEDYDMDYFYVDTSKLTAKQINEIKEKLDIEDGTPQTVVVENGKRIDEANGYKDPKEYIEFFKRNELVPEDAEYSAEKYITFIGYDEYNDLIDNGDTNVIVIGQTTCSHCISFKPAMNTIGKDYGITMNYLDILKLSNDEYTKFSNSLKDMGYTKELGTPLTLIVKDKKIIKSLSGERTISQLVREFKKADLID